MSDIYMGFDPARHEGRKNIQMYASTAAGDIARLDCEAREIIKDKEVLRELARREFRKWWAREKKRPSFSVYNEDPDSYDIESIQRIFTAEFRESYEYWIKDRRKYGYAVDEFEERILEPLPTGPTARIIETHHSEGARLYAIELVDPDYPGDRVLFEVQVDSHGETELREQA